MERQQRQLLHATLTRSSLQDIKGYWQHDPDDFMYDVLRVPETGMVMSVGRAENSGDPFNLGEVTVTRCAIRLISGETGVGYVLGSDKDHALHIAMIDALAQQDGRCDQLFSQVIEPLQKRIEHTKRQQEEKAAATKVEFLTMVRGED